MCEESIQYANPRFERRIALVSGASSGIGRAVAVRPTEEGCAVGLAARTRADLPMTAHEIEGEVDLLWCVQAMSQAEAA